jgi:asparagine synthase (glutamine-hydrolysing)
MCGICGQFNFRTGKPADEQTVYRMTSSLTHRGPDDEGYYSSGSLALGFRRLSIIDLAGGHQPMSDEEGRIWVVFNGEIYNFPELKAELEGYGFTFQTRSDTEVLIHGYRKWGTGLFQRLNGMFGVGIWDEKEKRLILARDPMGIKLVYYRLNADGIVFGSEIRAILKADGSVPELDPTALNLFLRYRYTPSPLTIHRDIHKLAPGTMLIVEGDRHRVERWYQYRPETLEPHPNDKQASEELLDLYKGAVKRHLLSDVPVGLLLSGGMDSGMLLALMNLYGEDWKTFTIGYGTSYVDDEQGYAAKTARHFRSDHASVQIDQSTFEEHLPGIVRFLEEPIASSSIVPMYFVCQRAREDVKVALIGQGPDELFGGYPRHVGIRYGGYWRETPQWISGAVRSLVMSMPRNETLKRGVESLSTEGAMERYRNVFSLVPGGLVDSLFKDGLVPADMDEKILQCWDGLEQFMGGTDELGEFQLLELRSSLPDELLMYADKLSMAHGLEVRVPYLDREVVEYVQRLSQRMKVRHGRRKWLHRKVCHSYLPDEFLKRKKRGFAVDVVDYWFRDSVDGKMGEYLSDEQSRMYEYLQPEVVGKLLQDHFSGRHDYHKILFSLVLFEEWLRSGVEQLQ